MAEKQGDEVSAKLTLPTDSKERKQYPLLNGCIKYFPAALAGIALISKEGNDKHNPGLPLHHARGLSMDHGDCIVRHLIDTEDLLAALSRTIEVDKGLVLQKQILTEVNQMAWRALAYSQMLHERFGAPLAPGADERLLIKPAISISPIAAEILSKYTSPDHMSANSSPVSGAADQYALLKEWNNEMTNKIKNANSDYANVTQENT